VTDEVGTKFDLDWLPTPELEFQVVEDLMEWRKPLWLAGLIGYSYPDAVGFGNMSARIFDKFVITGTNTGGKRKLKAQDFALVTQYSFEHNRVQCTGPVAASSESLTHAALYQLDICITAVVHVHSARLWTALKDKIPTTSSEVAYGTVEMAHEFWELWKDPRFKEDGIAVMGGHQDGLIAIGATVRQAAERILLLLTTEPSA